MTIERQFDERSSHFFFSSVSKFGWIDDDVVIEIIAVLMSDRVVLKAISRIRLWPLRRIHCKSSSNKFPQKPTNENPPRDPNGRDEKPRIQVKTNDVCQFRWMKFSKNQKLNKNRNLIWLAIRSAWLFVQIIENHPNDGTISSCQRNDCRPGGWLGH